MTILTAEVIRDYVDKDEWQISEIRAALSEADADDFATDAQVAALASKWNQRMN